VKKFTLYRNVRRLLMIILVVGVTVFILIGTIYVIERTNNKNQILMETSHDIDAFSESFTNKIASINSDLILLKDLLSLQNSLELNGVDTVFTSLEGQEDIEDVFSVWLERKGIYDQVRIIDNEGQEILRINKTETIPEVVVAEFLQNKANRYYFTDSIILTENQLYISKLDLNIENGEIELVNGETKPMIRFATPIFDDEGTKLGIIIINYLSADILDSLESVGLYSSSTIEMINEDGYFLFSKEEDRLFGFMYDDKIGEIYSKYYDYEIFENTSSEIIQNDYDGLNYSTIMITSEALAIRTSSLLGIDVDVILGSEDYCIVSNIDISSMPDIKFLNIIFTYISIFMFLVVVAVSRIIDELFFLKEEKLKTAEYAATHDILTNIPNRANIQNLIEYKITRKADFSLLYIDFDGFKKINDSFGHGVGDEALKAGVSRIQDSIRLDDIVARVGGDEFLVLIDGVTDKKVLSRICSTLLKNFSIDFDISGNICKMGLSIGISIHPKDSIISEELIINADKAMYDIKNQGKNNYRFYEDIKKT